MDDQELERLITDYLKQECIKAKLAEYTEVNLARSHLTRHFGLLYRVGFDRVARILSRIPLQEMIEHSRGYEE